jgi:hypothetical protein
MKAHHRLAQAHTLAHSRQLGDRPADSSQQGRARCSDEHSPTAHPLLALSDRSKPLPQRPGKPHDQPAGLCLDGSWLLYFHRRSVPIHRGVTLPAPAKTGSCNSGTSRTITCVAADHLCSKNVQTKRQRCRRLSAANVASTPSRTNTVVSRPAEGSDERSLVTRARSRLGAGAHSSTAAPPSRLVNDTVSHPGSASPAPIWSRRRRPEAALVLAGRATRVPQATVTSGIPRTITITPRRPVGWAHAPDLQRQGSPKTAWHARVREPCLSESVALFSLEPPIRE